MTTHSELDGFLQAVIGPDYAKHAVFGTDDGKGTWTVHRRLADLSDQLGCYWSIAAYPDDGIRQRTAARALHVRALFLDDIKPQDEAHVRAVLGPPSGVVRTSPDSCHWTYRLTTPVAVSDWNGFFRAVIAHVGAGDPQSCTSIHWTRLPIGRNLKPGRGGFKVELVKADKGAALDPATIPGWTPGSGKSLAASGPAHARKIWDIKELVAMTPNTGGWNEWVNNGLRIAAMMVDEADGREAFFELSQRPLEAGKVYSEDLTEGRWASFHPDRTDGGVMIDAAYEACVASGTVARFDRFWQREASLGPVFDDGLVGPDPFAMPPGKPGGTGLGPPGTLTATPYKWTDPGKIPPRDWLYGHQLIRKFISMTVAPGGAGKSSLVVAETLAQVTGRNLLGMKPAGELRVWLWNLEDPAEETARRVQAAALYYNITEADLGGRLFVDSGREQRLVVAEMHRDGPVIVRPVISALVEQIRARGIDIVVVDPFVSCHEVPENDNTAQDMVVKEWGRVAELGGCAVHLIDHTRKAGVGAEVGVESARGAKAKTDAARVVRVLNRMTDDQAKAMGGVPEPRRYFNTVNDKLNMAPPLDVRDWFYLESVNLGNGSTAASAFGGGSAGAKVVPGDSVGVARIWKAPTPQDMVTSDNFVRVAGAMAGKEWRKSSRAEDWVGKAVAKGLNLDPNLTKDKKTIIALIETWVKAGLMQIVEKEDKNRIPREFMEIREKF